MKNSRRSNENPRKQTFTSASEAMKDTGTKKTQRQEPIRIEHLRERKRSPNENKKSYLEESEGAEKMAARLETAVGGRRVFK